MQFLRGVLFLACIMAPNAWSQATTTSTVTGQVTDPQNAAIPGVEVRLVDTATGSTQSTVTNEAGRYIYVNVASGTYNLLFSKEGFAQARVTGQQVAVGATMTVNAALQVGATTTTVEVVATSAAELQTTNAQVGTTLNSEALLSLPNMGRDVSTLAVLQPGVSPTGFTAGSYVDQNTYMLDGGNISDDMAGNTTGYIVNFTGLGGGQTSNFPSGVIPTPVESIEEFRVSTFNQTADFNNSIGSNVQMVTKRGTNTYHGSGYFYYFATNVGAANSWINNHTPSAAFGTPYTPLPSNHRTRFGGTLGGILLPKLLGGKTYFFTNYEGSRFPNVSTYERSVPSDLMRAGVIQVPDSSGKYVAYNLNAVPVTVNGVTYNPATCPAGSCDPRGIGLNPIVNTIWQKYMPRANEFKNQGDLYNTQGFLSTIRAPLTQNVYIGRIDHDFGANWRFFASYRAMRLVNLTTNQVDIGGFFPGDALGTPAAIAPRPQNPSVWNVGVTTNVRPTVTNDVRFTYLRNFWQWGDANSPPQLPGLGGAVEIGGESANALIPYNVNTQSTRQRFWDGQDKTIKDDVTWIKGNHLIQFGGNYQRNFNYHSRTDNGQGINNQIVYQINNSGINFTNSPYIPTSVPSNQQSTYASLYAQVLGMVNQPQVAYTRAGANLQLQPVGSSAFDKSVIPYYNVYFGDTWHMRKSFTLTYSLGYGLELPPYEQDGKQVALVFPDGTLVDTSQYLAQRKQAALGGQVYEPIMGWSLLPNVAGHPKYPYNTFYSGVSPRVSAAWNPSYDSGLLGKLVGQGKTVLRAGYGRIYGRINGVNQVLVPLLGPGLLQAVACNGARMDSTCQGTGNVDPTNAFRIGTDGLVAPLPAVPQTFGQPYISGVQGAPANDATALDPNYRPQRTDNFNVTIQRQINSKNTIEVGYLGRIIRNEYQEINLDAVPYMTTLAGQSFAQAWGSLYSQVVFNGATPASVTAQPFLETALGGASSSYCAGYANCAAAFASKNTSLIRNSAAADAWAALYKAPSWTLPRSMISQNLPGLTQSQGTAFNMATSLGFGNYNALFLTHRMRDWHGITAVSNFTWGRALGTGALAQYNSSNTALDPWNMQANYGVQNYDVKFVYNTAMYWQTPWYRGQKGFLGKVFGGWNLAAIFTAQSGGGTSPTWSEGSCTGCQAFGEATPPASTTATTENAVGFGPYTGGATVLYNNPGANGVGTNSPASVNAFADPSAVIKQFRPCVLGIDTSCGGYYNLRLPSRWNLDANLTKDISWFEGRVGATFAVAFTNVMNHNIMSGPSLTITSPTTFGRINGSSSTPRNMEFSLKLHF
ncbi:MAG TPA: carboxypeptidase-like regulatory domain-containing protein [Candidatus Acidoferrales bacterium]|nr:carboxypeptidase-like regulatory domain-containing protein [Candidatus Acidoferrales bacterium]